LLTRATGRLRQVLNLVICFYRRSGRGGSAAPSRRRRSGPAGRACPWRRSRSRRRDAVLLELRRDRFRTAAAETHVVGVRADRIGVTGHRQLRDLGRAGIGAAWFDDLTAWGVRSDLLKSKNTR
jgi:hypothetical protein